MIAKLFGIHIKKENNCIDEQNPHICIGWSELGDLSKVKNKEELSVLYESIYPNVKKKTKSQDIGQLSRFLFETNIGDYVIYRKNKTIYIGKIISDYYKKTLENQDKDYCHNRNVNWIATFSSDMLSKDATHSLGSAMTYFSMDKHKDEINKLLDGKSNIETIRKEDFKKWLSNCEKPNGEKYSFHYVQLCISTLCNIHKEFDISPYKNIMEISDVNELDSIIKKVKSSDNFDEFNNKNGNRVLASSLNLYSRFIKGFHKEIIEKDFNLSQQNNTTNKINKPYNRIVFGAPGTGKSYMLNDDRDVFDNHFERVTFHPEYTYSDFVGVYKPIMKGDNIIYSFVAGPFLRVLKCALENPDKNYLLLIEEINRANMAGVFGDVFQLLDRDDNGESVYSINVSDDIKNYLEKDKIINLENNELKIPSNMYIWATMNSADQGVYPMDTAFKRRWTFEYISINANDSEIKDIECGGNLKGIKWNDLRKAINEKLFSISNVSEDKCLGPFFLSKSDLQSDKFDEIFKSKVLMYLFEDVVKQRTSQLFFKGTNSFSEICEQYNSKGIEVFCNDIIASKFLRQQDTTTENAEDESQEND